MRKRLNYNLLELTSRNQFLPARGYEKKIELVKIKKNHGFSYQEPQICQSKGRWWTRLCSGNDVLRNALSYPEVHFFVALYKGAVVGLFDLIVLPDRQVEIRNFRIVDESIEFETRALFLSKVVDYCFQFEPRRIFCRASEFDKMSAISNYLSQGFSITTSGYDEEQEADVSEPTSLQSNFLVNLN
ncbi:hypothetical protein [Carboxylicivirga taeanensis]|uniref:hypothetical protein n=1 Tax=Carboxylicivirga taeanensis TaxID=1416875 RepID=UPI003F6DC1BF